jgi:hypothetical protein
MRCAHYRLALRGMGQPGDCGDRVDVQFRDRNSGTKVRRLSRTATPCADSIIAACIINPRGTTELSLARWLASRRRASSQTRPCRSSNDVGGEV